MGFDGRRPRLVSRECRRPASVVGFLPLRVHPHDLGEPGGGSGSVPDRGYCDSPSVPSTTVAGGRRSAGISWSPIPSGGTFDYRFTLKDAGLFWFHPHMRSDVQVNKGLYGAIRVRAEAEPIADQEKILVLDDIKLKPDGSIPDFLDDSSLMMGRGGNTVLVNGSADATLRFRPNATTRLRIVNAANGRFFNLALPGVKLHLNGNKDAYILEGSDISKYDSAQQSWVPQGNVIDLSGKSPVCAWDQSIGNCK